MRLDDRMETLYDKKYVYFDWDDKLEGKKGFFGDNIKDLKQNVIGNRTMWYGEICHNVNTNTDYPFGFIDEVGNSHCFRFCYYDPYYEFRKAYLEGKQLQFRTRGNNWEDVLGEPVFNGDEYRIKPESEYVPFDTVDELIKCWEKKFPGNANRPEYTMPLIWIKNKEKNRVYLISDFLFDKCYGNDVGTYESDYKLKDLFNDFTFLDGSIIGKKKE